MKLISKEEGRTQTSGAQPCKTPLEILNDIAKAAKSLKAIEPGISPSHEIYYNYRVALSDAEDAAQMFALFISDGDEKKADGLLEDCGLSYLKLNAD